MQKNINPKKYNKKLKFYANEILKRFLISKNTPNSLKEKLKIEKILKNISIIIWLDKTKILSYKEEKKILEELKELYDNFNLINIKEKTDYIIQNLKNLSPKVDIIECIADIEFNFHIKEKGDIQKLNEKFEKIIGILKTNNNQFILMKLERDLKEIKNRYFKDLSDFNILIQSLDTLI